MAKKYYKIFCIAGEASGDTLSANLIMSLTKENIQKLYDTYDSINEIRNLQQIKDTVGVSPRLTEFYAVFRSLLEFKQTTFQPIKDEEVVEKELNDDEIKLLCPVAFKSRMGKTEIQKLGLSKPWILIMFL